MALLEDSTDSGLHLLPAQTLIGRSRTCQLRIAAPEVSGQHALLRWTEKRWELRDLGSRNGTFVNGRRLPPGERVLLSAGDRIGLGADDGRWRLSNAAAPAALARALDGGEVISASGGLLALPPDAEPPEVLVFRDPEGRWVVERDAVLSPAGDTLVADGRSWQLFLPEPDEETLRAGAPSVHEIQLRFEVSSDEEYARMTIGHRDDVIPLQARAHHYLLLTLARIRLEDQARDPEQPSAHGWVHLEDLARMLRQRERQLNLQVFRARKQVAEAGVEEAASIVERRPSSRQLRIGVSDLVVTTV